METSRFKEWLQKLVVLQSQKRRKDDGSAKAQSERNEDMRIRRSKTRSSILKFQFLKMALLKEMEDEQEAKTYHPVDDLEG
uniref:Uncharacterized protein n=1 Tax=Ditylenchus dipsaci TaxID=166011 RepID=A0A915DWA3_9BILA